MTPKQYLQQAYLLNELIDSNIVELEMLQATKDGLSGISYDKENVQGGKLPTSQPENITIKIERLQEEINREIDQYVDLKLDIHAAINRMRDSAERLILRLRYIEFRQWDDIQTVMKKERTQVFSIHQKALNHFVVPEKVQFPEDSRTKTD